MMEFVIFDTETTGLLQPVNSELSMQPKIIEFYGVRLNEEFAIQSEVNELIDPGEPISQEITNITKITDSMVKGKQDFHGVSKDIAELFDGVDLSVAHNHAFDSGMLDVEFKRIDKFLPRARHQLCSVEATMFMTNHRLSLTRLHWMLFQEQFTAHRAKDDVFALVRCFHNLTESGAIKLEHYTD